MNRIDDTAETDVASIRALVARLERRLRLQQAAAGFVEGGSLALMIGAVAIAATRTGWAEPEYWWMWLIVAFLAAIAAVAYRALQPVDTIGAARQLDRSHGLNDRLSTALSLAQRDDLSDANRRFIRAQIDDAIRHIDDVEPRHAAPWRRPPDTLLLALVTAAVVSIAVMPMPDHEEPLPKGFDAQHDRVLDDTTVTLERERLRQFRDELGDDPDGELQQLADDIEELLDAVEHREISDREFAERVDELLDDHLGEDTTAQNLDTLSDALAEAARQSGDDHDQAMEENPELQAAMDALDDGDFQRAADELSELAERLDDEELSADEAQRLADVLDDFADHIDGHRDRLQELYDEHSDQFEDLADQFDGDLSPEQEQLLDDARQAMDDAADNLDNFEDSSSERQLDQLSRELDDAADDLRDEPPEAGDGADDPGQDDPGQDDPGQDDQQEPQQPDDGEQPQDQQQPPPVADQQPDGGDPPQQPEEQDDHGPDYRNPAGRQLDDAAEQLEDVEQQRQQQQQREQAREQLEDMRDSMARGDREDDSQRAEQMEDFLDRARGDDSDAEGQQPDSDDDGQQMPAGPGDEGAESDGPDDLDPDDAEFGSGDGDGGLDDGVDGDEDDIDFQHRDEQLDGVDGQEGPSRSEVVQSAAEEGFATTDYQDVYGDYEDVAEEVMERDEVPDGYRYYIERYFELIRPQTH